ncbi:MAG: lysophospholipase L1-like esterase/pimeloyl-ACP methyl ester carboxylesterase [Planctomycetota bacterium]|jgi:lysophospholipase L1-like esterase/pimeloyl-ACP methyl ester carboxylesterase
MPLRLSSLILGFLFLAFGLSAAVAAQATKWNGFERSDFVVAGRKCCLVSPKNAAEGRPWVWRARFFGHEPQADILLLNQGFHLAYSDVAGLFGNDQAVKAWDAFYDVLIKHHRLAKKPALEGMSRGGLIIYNWAARNPEKVACIYGDAPVCDFRSWPGGKGAGKGHAESWQACLRAYGLTEEDALHSPNPIDNLEPLAKAGIPLLHVVGDSDEVVPVAENTDVIESRYKKLGGSIQVIRKPGVGHHPHALKNPGPIVSFIRKHTIPNIRLRGTLDNSRLQFDQSKMGHVAFLGGSITERDGFRPLVCQALKSRFPKTKFKFTNAGIASTCSTFGAFRLSDHVLNHGPVDLLFVEFAVNDASDANHSRQQIIRGIEGIIRQARRHNPAVDIVVTFFVTPNMINQFKNGQTPLVLKAHEDVARHYGVSTINLAKEVSERIADKRITWEQYGGVHPKHLGNQLCADLVERLLNKAWNKPLTANATRLAHALPETPLTPAHLGNGKLVAPDQAKLGKGWRVEIPDWKSLPGNKRSRFTNIPILCADKEGAELQFEFSGTTVGGYILAGPDAGSLEAKVDDGNYKTFDLFHRFSKNLHYPRVVLFANGLAPGRHTLNLRVAKSHEVNRCAARILKFTVN